MSLLEGNVKRKSRLAFVLILLLTGLFSFFSSRLEFDYNFENFFPRNDGDLEYYLNFRDTYGYDNEYLLIGLVNEEGIFDPNFLSSVDFIADTLKK